MRYAPLLAALVLVVAYGVAEGLWTHRWFASDEVPRAVARLSTVPLTVGDWVGQDKTLSAREIDRAEMDGYVRRHYVHRKTGQTLRVLLVCGRPGPTSLHTPEVCYEGVGYKQVGDKKEHQQIKTDGQDQPAEFWVARYKKDGPDPDPLRIAWAWSATGQWLAPEQPRLVFASSGALFKLYVVQPLVKLDDSPEDASTDFLKVFLPELGKCLFPAAEAPGKG